MSTSQLLTQRQVRRMEQLVRDRKLPVDTGAPSVPRRPGAPPRRSRQRPTSARIKTVQSYLHLYG